MKKNKLAIMYALIAVGMWSTVATAFKLSLAEMSLLQLLTGASFFSTLVLGIFLLLQRKLLEAIADISLNIQSILFLALLNPVVYYIILFKAYDLLPAQVAQPLNFTWAITMTLLSVPLLKHTLTKHELVAIVLSYGGVVLLSLSGKSMTGELNYWGIFLALLSTIIWSLYWLLNARDKRPPIIKLFQSFLFSVPILLLITLLYEGAPDNYSVKQLFGVVYVGVFEMGLAFICWQLAIHHTDKVSRISTLIFLSPFVSLFIINRVLGEPLFVTTFVGLALIVIGITLQNTHKSD